MTTIRMENTSFSSRLSGYVDWSLANFTLDKLIDGSAFPAFSAHELTLYNSDGNEIENGDDKYMYVPFVNFDCLQNMSSTTFNFTTFENITGLPDETYVIMVWGVRVMVRMGNVLDEVGVVLKVSHT